MVVGHKLFLYDLNLCAYFQEHNDDKKDKSKEKKKVIVKTIELPIDAKTHGFSRHELNSYMEQEVIYLVFIIFNDNVSLMSQPASRHSCQFGNGIFFDVFSPQVHRERFVSFSFEQKLINNVFKKNTINSCVLHMLYQLNSNVVGRGLGAKVNLEALVHD